MRDKLRAMDDATLEALLHEVGPALAVPGQAGITASSTDGAGRGPAADLATRVRTRIVAENAAPARRCRDRARRGHPRPRGPAWDSGS